MLYAHQLIRKGSPCFRTTAPPIRPGDWAIFLFGLFAVIIVAVFIMMLVTYRRDQL